MNEGKQLSGLQREKKKNRSVKYADESVKINE